MLTPYAASGLQRYRASDTALICECCADQPSYGGADSSADVLFLLPGNSLCGSTPNGTVFKKDSAVFVDSPTVTLPAC